MKEWTRERVPLDWAITQYNLGITLANLGGRQAMTDKAKGCAALEEFRKAGASYYVSVAEGNIAKLGTIIARLCG